MLVDGHEDLALNVVSYRRDYLTSARAIRALEADAPVPNGLCMLGLEEWLAGGIGVVFATIAAIPREHAFEGEQSYETAADARAAALEQLAVYERWDASDAPVSIVRSAADLERREGVKLVLLMENADPIRDLDDVAFWHAAGVRIVGPAWHANRYSADTRAPGPLTELGRGLVPALAAAGIALDVTHMADEAAREALALTDGPVCATHAHARRTLDLPRLLPDDVVREIAGRGGVVGVLPANWALQAEWRRGDPRVPLDRVADAVDDLVALTRSAGHVAIGTDFDGGQGAETAPAGVETIADLSLVGDVLRDRGYDDAAVEGILGANWLRWLRGVLG